MRILIAEDESISRRVLENTLATWNYDVVATNDGTKAWEVLQCEDRPPLAVLDIMMPGLSGLDLCRKVRKLDLASPLYIVLLTARTDKEQVVQGLEAGANDYLAKPYDREELRARLRVGAEMVELQQSLAARVLELEDALRQINQLQDMLPICSYCKSIRNDQNYWQRVDSYISERTNTQFSHGICPTCYESVVEPQLEKLRSRSSR